jgi:hypothetical protein
MLAARIQHARLISVHSVKTGLYFKMSQVHPGEFRFPSVRMSAAEITEACTLNFISMRLKEKVNLQFAEKRSRMMDGRLVPYLLLTVTEASNPVPGFSQQTTDEFGVKMYPDVMRMQMPISANEVANEVERQLKQYGIVTIAGEDATDDEIRTALNIHKAWKFKQIKDANEGFLKNKQGGVSMQQVELAWEMYKEGLLSPLPVWASENPSADAVADQMQCPGCGTLVQQGRAKCAKCSWILDWRMAVEGGLVKPQDVPQSKRREAGLAEAEEEEGIGSIYGGKRPTKEEKAEKERQAIAEVAEKARQARVDAGLPPDEDDLTLTEAKQVATAS